MTRSVAQAAVGFAEALFSICWDEDALLSTCWDVVEIDGSWVLVWAKDDLSVPIASSMKTPWTLAVDAACEFMDRYDRFNGEPNVLMGLCFRNACRQR